MSKMRTAWPKICQKMSKILLSWTVMYDVRFPPEIKPSALTFKKNYQICVGVRLLHLWEHTVELKSIFSPKGDFLKRECKSSYGKFYNKLHPLPLCDLKLFLMPRNFSLYVYPNWNKLNRREPNISKEICFWIYSIANIQISHYWIMVCIRRAGKLIC